MKDLERTKRKATDLDSEIEKARMDLLDMPEFPEFPEFRGFPDSSEKEEKRDELAVKERAAEAMGDTS